MFADKATGEKLGGISPVLKKLPEAESFVPVGISYGEIDFP